MSVAEAVEEALAGQASSVPLPPVPPERRPEMPGHADGLTRREREVAGLIARGYSDRQIAEALTITVGTVGVHVHRILDKLGLRSRWQVADWMTKDSAPETVVTPPNRGRGLNGVR